MRGSSVVAVASACMLQIAAASAPKGCCRSNHLSILIGSPLNNGVEDCSENLLVTVTALRSSAFTTTTTVTQTGVETALFTETATQTAATETLVSTAGITVTDEIKTNTAGPTVTVTGTGFSYALAPIKARVAAITILLDPVHVLPTYASSACSGSWDAYTSACRCAGFEPTTITVPGGAAPTVTVTVSTSVVGSTLSQGETQTAFVTATTKTTVTETVTSPVPDSLPLYMSTIFLAPAVPSRQSPSEDKRLRLLVTPVYSR
ncbi:hypothetical protein PG996_015904 [Apiospora saccharicola]|uniref:IPT/TIG domain-containing protein n=1 Tax=Apiospora saccharicola TaxID=335842 RepID=A0ABR1TPM7_9PEZI